LLAALDGVVLDADPEAFALPLALTSGETEFAVSPALLRAPLAAASPLDTAPLARDSAEEPAPAAVPVSPDEFALPEAEPLTFADPARAEPLPATEPALFNTPLA
jgi:hypothetical protein